jgi:16S rRNA (adenine1518-N6/adenine1519-N6)-dimethyltransferase
VTAAFPGVRVLHADALEVDWDRALGTGAWRMASNLPYNVAVPILFRMLADAPAVAPYVVMVQREVADRLVAAPGTDAYGAVSAKLAVRSEASFVRRVPREVFWPRPRVDSAVVRITPRAAPSGVDRDALLRLIDVSFAERRKTMTNALRRLGLGRADAESVLADVGIERSARPETLGLDAFVRLTARVDPPLAGSRR